MNRTLTIGPQFVPRTFNTHAYLHTCIHTYTRTYMHACMQAAEVRTADVCGFDMSAINRHRWHPGHAAGLPVYLIVCASLRFHVSVRMSVRVCSLSARLLSCLE